jgi:hypothetical protein
MRNIRATFARLHRAYTNERRASRGDSFKTRRFAMRTKIALITSLAALGVLVPAAAMAQDVPVPPAGPSGEPPPAGPAAAPAAAPPEAAPAAAPEAAPAAPAAPTAWPGWMRIDSDLGGVQLWAGATAPLADGIGLAFDAYVFGSLGEFDIGPAIAVGPLTLTPMLGAQIDWSSHQFAALVPQLYLTGSAGPIYEELWLQYYNYKSVYDYTNKHPGGGAPSYFYARAFVDYKISDFVAVGPQIELTNDFEAKEVAALPVGANVFFFQAGANSTFQAFLGYETKKTFDDNHLAGRLSYVHNF